MSYLVASQFVTWECEATWVSMSSLICLEGFINISDTKVNWVLPSAISINLKDDLVGW